MRMWLTVNKSIRKKSRTVFLDIGSHIDLIDFISCLLSDLDMSFHWKINRFSCVL
uniref:Uncharacterized protein n=1 Tax=Human betaherpesvirus 6 TaxID=10368 RepID=A0A5P9VJA3_9BETA|nr:hypothetical protein [Human betaherpesvirus 6]QFX28758.1 hypothetical protein [Human betaherpesvirus 6]QFX53690.1 hypothetical protein [Human betaherpesvirus 6]